MGIGKNLGFGKRESGIGNNLGIGRKQNFDKEKHKEKIHSKHDELNGFFLRFKISQSTNWEAQPIPVCNNVQFDNNPKFL